MCLADLLTDLKAAKVRIPIASMPMVIVRLFCAHGPRWCLELELEPKWTWWCLGLPVGSIVNLGKGGPAAY